MAELKTKEDILYFMRSGVLRVSRSDLKFIENLHTIANNKKYVTSNQVNLLDKIIFKYERQIAKHDLHVQELVALPWKVEVLSSAPQYTDAFISIEEGMLYFKSPYNKQFINDLRTQNNLLTWNTVLKRYEGTYSTTTLKMIVDVSYKHFNNVNHCSETIRLLNSLEGYTDTTCWNPTLMSVNGNLMVAGINSHLADAINDIKLTNDKKTLATLAGYGISIHPSLLKTDVELFAASYAPMVEIANITELVWWLKELECDYVYVSGGNSLSRVIKTLANELNTNNIPHSIVTYRDKPIDINQFKFPVLIRFTRTGSIDVEQRKIAKLITMINSEPIDIK
jgi:hypothetical protein